MLGLCARAGKLACGTEPALAAVRSGSAFLVAMEPSAGPNTRKALKNACASHGVRLLEIEGLGDAVGKSGRMAAAVLGRGMAARVEALFDRETG